MIALIVAVGLVIVPVLYAWFNIAGQLGPVRATPATSRWPLPTPTLGYDERPLSRCRVNIGESRWCRPARERPVRTGRFVSESDARRRASSSGEYYAAVVIPENFQLAHDDASFSSEA
ncbi:MAG: hypothetical protein ACLTSX_09710 [Collinsella sp.]